MWCYTFTDPATRHHLTADSGKATRRQAFWDLRRYVARLNLARGTRVPHIRLPQHVNDIKRV